MRNHSPYRKKHNRLKSSVILLSVLVFVAVLVILLSAPKSTRLKYSVMAEGNSWQAIVVFNEVHVELPDNERVIFAVPNNSKVQAQDVIGEYYKKGYITSAFEAYSELQQKIVAYQNDVLLKDIYQNEINQYAIDISTILTEFKTYDPNKNDYIILNERLISLMSERQEYIRDNYPADENLQALYDEELERLNALNDWIQPIQAVGNGYVSWYVNSEFNQINTMTAPSLRPSDIKELLQQDSIYKNVNNSSDFSVRIISDEYVYFAFIATGEWNIGQQLVLYNDVNDDQIICSVVSVNGEGGEKSIIVRADGEVAPFLEHRVVTIAESPLVSGFVIDKNFILNDGSGDYILINDSQGERRQVFIEVLAQNDNKAAIMALEDGIITQDTEIFNK